MDIFDVRRLNPGETQAIRDFVGKICLNLNVPNKLLRDDIFALLHEHCIVVYYPLDDKENNGFHVECPVGEEDKHFVYINTAQFKEKQIFTAAHEFGHICGLSEWMREKNFSGDSDWEERVTNRFAAELLMPQVQFLAFYEKTINAVRDHQPGKGVTLRDMVYVVTSIMQEFFTPYKSVVYRLFELEMISERVGMLLWGELDCSRETLEKYSLKVSREQGFSRLYQTPDRHKWIDGLKELLDKAKDERIMPRGWLESFYNRFELEIENNNDLSENSLPEVIIEGGDSDAQEGSN